MSGIAEGQRRVKDAKLGRGPVQPFASLNFHETGIA
jgi:hypothetical protein